jgi:hypothetical protein
LVSSQTKKQRQVSQLQSATAVLKRERNCRGTTICYERVRHLCPNRRRPLLLWAGRAADLNGLGVSEHSARIPAQAKCPRSNTRRDGPESGRWTEETDGRPCRNAMAGHYSEVLWLAAALHGPAAREMLLRPGSSVYDCTHASQFDSGVRVRSERGQREHVQRGDSRECDTHVMSAAMARSVKRATPGTCERRGAGDAHSWLLLNSILSVQSKSARKTCRCTTSLVLDVTAVTADRTRATCGVGDVLAALAPLGMGRLSHAFLPSQPVSHPSPCFDIHCRVSRPEANEPSSLDGACCDYTRLVLSAS